MKFCTKCGKELHDDAVICTGCGCMAGGELRMPKLKNPKIEKIKQRNDELLAKRADLLVKNG